MRKNFLVPILLFTALLTSAEPGRLAVMKARSAEMRLNRMLLNHPAGISAEQLETAKQEVAAIADDLKLGREWQAKPPVLYLPHLSEPPKIDGKAGESIWKQALEWKGSYPCSSTVHRNDGSVWRLAWYGNRIFGSVFFPGANPVFYKGRAGAPCSVKRVWQGNCLEVFIQPEPEIRYYAEFLFRPDDTPWNLDHVLNGNGRWVTVHFHLNADVEVAGQVTPDGYELEFSIDPCFMRKDWRERGLRRGDRFKMAMVRIKPVLDEQTEQSSFFPLLYSGHNTFSYAVILLENNRR